MKTCILFIILSAVSSQILGQINQETIVQINQDSLPPFNKIGFVPEASSPDFEWYNFSEAVGYNFPFGTLWPMLLWPDSNAVIINSSTQKRKYDIHGFADLFDPISDYIAQYAETAFGLTNSEDWLTPYHRFLVDSVRFYYSYNNFHNSTDTLKIYIISPSSTAYRDTTFTDYPTAGENSRLGLIYYDHEENRPLGTLIEERIILLDNADTATFPNLQMLTLSLDDTIPADLLNKSNKIGIALQFVPGHPYNDGDTLLYQAPLPVQVKNPANQFWLLTYEENVGTGFSDFPVSYNDGSINQGQIVTSSVRYNKNPGWNGNYINTFAFTADFRYEHLYVDWLLKPEGASFFASTTPCVDQPVDFIDQSNISPVSWQWSFGDGGTATQQNPLHEFTAPGSYTVCLKAKNTVDSFTFCKNYVVSWCTGIKEPHAQKLAQVHFNNHQIDVKLKHPGESPADIRVLNLNGSLIYKTQTSDGTTIPIPHLSNGIYLLQIRQGEASQTEKFVR